VNMNEKICKICNKTLPITEFHTNKQRTVNFCKDCSKEKQERFDDLGINLPEEELTRNTRFYIHHAKEILTLMGYDVNLPIYPQFKERIRVKTGVELD